MSPPDTGDATRISHALPIVFEAIMQLDGVPIHPGTDDSIIAMDVASEDNIVGLFVELDDDTMNTATCAEDGAGYCITDVDQFGAYLDQMVQAYESDASREALDVERDRRICHVLETVEPADDRFESAPIRFENRPALPIECRGL